MTTMPAKESSMPASWRADTRSRSIAQEQAMVNSGIDAFSRTALTVVVVDSPR